MKYLSLLFLVFYAPYSFSLEIPSHHDFCKSNCSDIQKRIVSEYDELTELNIEYETMFSGECYQYGPGYDGKHTHYGMVLLHKKEDAWYMGSLLGYFFKENPYRKFDVDAAKKRLVRYGGNLYEKNKILRGNSKEGFVDISDGGAPLIYWLKSTSANDLKMIVRWGYRNKITCELLRH